MMASDVRFGLIVKILRAFAKSKSPFVPPIDRKKSSPLNDLISNGVTVYDIYTYGDVESRQEAKIGPHRAANKL